MWLGLSFQVIIAVYFNLNNDSMVYVSYNFQIHIIEIDDIFDAKNHGETRVQIFATTKKTIEMEVS